MLRFKKIALTLICLPTIYISSAQISCSEAPRQLAVYASNVNAFANSEYLYAIPSRCGGNYYCMNQQKAYLDQWYYQQYAAINQCYQTIVRTCSYQQPRSLPRVGKPTEGGETISDTQIEQVAVDDEKANNDVAISIPTDGVGYRSKPRSGSAYRTKRY